MSAPFTYWQDEKDGMWVGYWNEYPDYPTQGHTFDELKQMLVSLRRDIIEMDEDGTMVATRRNVGVLAYE